MCYAHASGGLSQSTHTWVAVPSDPRVFLELSGMLFGIGHAYGLPYGTQSDAEPRVGFVWLQAWQIFLVCILLFFRCFHRIAVPVRPLTFSTYRRGRDLGSTKSDVKTLVQNMSKNKIRWTDKDTVTRNS